MRTVFGILTCLLLAPTLRGDTLTLRDGSHYRGTLVRQSPTEVVFRIELDGGKSSLTRTFAAGSVRSIEKSDEEPSEEIEPLTGPPAPDHATGRGEAVSDADADQILREAFELAEDGDAAAALRAMSRLVRRAAPRTLKALEDATIVARGIRLDEWMAGMRVQQAMDAYARSTFTIKHATRYESAALGRALEGLLRERLARRFAKRTLEEWSRDGADYTALEDDARAMVEDARLCAAILTARMRIDPRVTRSKPERIKLDQIKTSLTKLAAEVASMPGFTRIPKAETVRAKDDPTVAEAGRIATEAMVAAEQKAAAEADASETEPRPVGPARSDPESGPPADGESDDIRFDRPAARKPAAAKEGNDREGAPPAASRPTKGSKP